MEKLKNYSITMTFNPNFNILLKLSNTCVLSLDTQNYRKDCMYSLYLNVLRPDGIVWQFNIRKFKNEYKLSFDRIRTIGNFSLYFCEKQSNVETFEFVLKKFSVCQTIDELLLYFGVKRG